MKNLFTAFVEHKEFKKSRPWTVVRQKYDSAVISTPHYAETVEILVCDSIVGSAYIGGERFDMSGKKVFYIAPQTVHSFEYQKSEGSLLVIKLHLEMLKEFINVPNIFAQYGLTLSDPMALQDDYDAFFDSAARLDSGDVAEALLGISTITKLLCENSIKKSSDPQRTSDSSINEIIEWTEKNYGEKISLESVSKKFGYTRNYFCEMFKKSTGNTYITYLNSLRISNACAMLRVGVSVKDACERCGFETDSYFIKLFKSTVGTTPKQYSKNFKTAEKSLK